MKDLFCYEAHLNIALLDQAVEFLTLLNDAFYAHPIAPLSEYGIGSHIRHCTDFYENFFLGLSSRFIDYDRRKRDELIALNRRAAITALHGIRTQLNALTPDLMHQAISVASERIGTLHAEATASSVGRELTFLASHCVHHFAIIAMLARARGVEPPHKFGVAASTLVHWEEKACAQ